MFFGSGHHILNFHVKQTSWIWILRNRHFLHMVAQHSLEVSSCPALIAHIGRKWTGLQHWGLPYKCTSSFFFSFKIQTPFGFRSGFVLHFNCGDAFSKYITNFQIQLWKPFGGTRKTGHSLLLHLHAACPQFRSSTAAHFCHQNWLKTKNSESLNKVSSGQVMQQDWPSWNS